MITGVDEGLCEIRMHRIASADRLIAMLAVYPELGWE
jgi:hypothetical protein